MLKKILVLTTIFASTSAFAQQQTPDPVFMQRAITSLQAQRNSALDAQIVAEAKLAGVSEDLAKAQARIKELEGLKPEAPKSK